MKKDKAVRKAEMKSALIEKLKGLIVPGIFLLIIAAGFLVIMLYTGGEEEEKIIEVHSYVGDGGPLTMENDFMRFEMDGSTTQFTVTDKKSGAVWYSNPPDAAEDPIAVSSEKGRLQSTLVLTYSNSTGHDVRYDNFDYSIENGTYEIEQGTDDQGEFIKVYYSIGDVAKVFAIPEVISEARMNELMDKLEQGDRNRAINYYKKYDINNLGKKDDKEALLAQYPMLETEVIYTLRPNLADNVKGMLQTIFESAGYTYEESLEDKAVSDGAAGVKRTVFNLNIVYRLNGEQMSVEVPLSEIEYYDSYPVYSLSVLPYFGCGGTQDEGYLMVPEGGGGLINFNNGKTSQSVYYANMYGWDQGVNRDAVVHETETYFNAFGIARNGSSFICILDDGAPYAGITADISGKNNSYNAVSAQYSLLHREIFEMGSRNDTQVYLYEPALPDENLKLSYRFIDSDSYIDMAMVYRQYMQDEYGGLLAESEDSHTPVVVEIVGAIDKVEQFMGVPVSRPLPMTTYGEAQAILEQLTSEGMGNMSVKLSGWMNGGVRQKILKHVKLVSGLGGKKALKSLTSYAAENGIDLYLDGITNYAYDSNIFDGFFPYTDAARFASKELAVIYPYNTVSFVAREGQEPHYLLKGTLIDDMVENLAEAAEKYNANVSFADIGKDLNADYYRKDTVTRQEAMTNQVGYLKNIKDSGKKIMINTGNNYAVAYSDIVTGMDLYGSDYTIIDEHVPIYQMAIHGFVDYTGEPLNLTQNMEDVLLNSAEYGAGLAFTLMDESAFTLQKTLYTEYFGSEYDACHDSMLEIYKRYDSELGHVFNQQMVSHEKISPTLSCTKYADGTTVYVNYSYDTVKTPDGKEISARDYLVIR